MWGLFLQLIRFDGGLVWESISDVNPSASTMNKLYHFKCPFNISDRTCRKNAHLAYCLKPPVTRLSVSFLFSSSRFIRYIEGEKVWGKLLPQGGPSFSDI